MNTVTVTVDVSGNRVWRNAANQYHRLDGPAYEGANGVKSWWVNDQLHRLDGAAVEYADGGKAWYLYNEYLTEAEFNRRVIK